MTWKTARRSFYYDGAPEPQEPVLVAGKVALLVIDVQNVYLDRPDPSTLTGEELARYHAWTPFHERMHGTVIPSIRKLLQSFRSRGLDVLYARIAALRHDGRDRSLSQKKPGWNDLLLPKDELPSQIVPAIAPEGDEIVVTKTTDSALTGTNLFAPEIYFLSKLPAVVKHVEVATVTGIDLVLSFLATIYPSWRAARIEPAEALRYE